MSDEENSIESLSDHEDKKSVSNKSQSGSDSPKPQKYELKDEDNLSESHSNASKEKENAPPKPDSSSSQNEDSDSESEKQFGQNKKLKKKRISKGDKKKQKGKDKTQRKKREPKEKKGEENIKNQELYDNMAKELIDKMEKAYTLDREANSKNKPATHKMLLAPTVTQQLKKQCFQDSFLESGGLDSFGQWMQKLPDGSEAPLTLKRSILENIRRLKITDRDQILYSKIGKIVYELRKRRKDENPEIQKMASDIVDSWTQVITNTKSFYGRGGERQ